METTIDPALVGTAEAAFIADRDPRELHRLVDEAVLGELVEKGESRRFFRLGAALAKFYLDTADDLSKAVRVRAIDKVMGRLRDRTNLDAILGLSGPLGSIDWALHFDYFTVDLGTLVEAAAERSRRALDARRLIVEDPDVLGGRPTFRGTRIAIDVAVGAPTTGGAWDRLCLSYPMLTPDHVDAANVYSVIRPRRGRPPRALEGATIASGWRLRSTRRIVAGS